MQTLLLFGLGYLVLSGSKSTSTPQQTAPPPPQKPVGSDLAAAFGSFVGGLIAQASKDNP